MKERVLVFILVLLIIIGAVSFKLNFVPGHQMTGKAVSSSSVNFTIAGSAGLNLADDNILFGSGYYNWTCGTDFALLNSNGSRVCWVNTSAFAADYHEVVNNGSVTLNLSANIATYTDAEEFFCGTTQGCLYSNTAEVLIQASNGEANSCNGLMSGLKWVLTNSTSRSLTICNIMDFADSSDDLKVYVELHVPVDATAGNKTFSVNYVATAL
jgi:hypothetical protein